MRHALVAATLIAVLSLSAPARALDQPDCTALDKWSAGYDTKDTITLAPKVVISALFADDRTVPVFGAPVAAWTRNDFTQVGRWLGDCRRANRKNKPVANRLYKAYQVMRKAAGPAYKMERFRQRSDQAVNNLVGYHRTDTLTKVLALARKALQGADVTAEVRALRVNPGVQTEVQALFNASGYLADADRQALDAKLDQGAGAVKQEMAARDEAFDDLKRQLADVPMTMAGLRTLDRLYNDPALSKVSRQDAIDFQTAIMHKRQTISRVVRQQQAQKQAAAAKVPVKVAARLGTLLKGDDVAEISLNGIRPGIAYADAKRVMAGRFGYKSGSGGDVFKAFGPTRRDSDQYKRTERRDGGIMELETMGDAVGQLTYTEHFAGPIDLNEPRNWLTDRLGKPDQFKFTGDGIIMAWADDGMNLVISPANRLRMKYRNPYNSGYKSSVVITLWSDAYKQFLADAEKRCDELRHKPMSQLSVQDKMDMMRGCK